MRIEITETESEIQIWERVSLAEYLAVIDGDHYAWEGVDVELPKGKGWGKYSAIPSADRSSREKRERKWDLGADYKKAVHLSRYGWDEAPRIEGLSNVLANAAGTAGTEVELERGMTGPMVDLGAYATGNPEAFFDFAPMPVQPVIKVGYETGTPYFVKAEHMALRGAVVYNVAEWLKGKAILEVSALATARGTHGSGKDVVCTTEIVVCDERYPLDSNGLAFFTAHPAAFRRLQFAWKELHCEAFRKAFAVPHGGYGVSEMISDETRRPEVYFGKQCPESIADAAAAVTAAVQNIKREYFAIES